MQQLWLGGLDRGREEAWRWRAETERGEGGVEGRPGKRAVHSGAEGGGQSRQNRRGAGQMDRGTGRCRLSTIHERVVYHITKPRGFAPLYTLPCSSGTQPRRAAAACSG